MTCLRFAASLAILSVLAFAGGCGPGATANKKPEAEHGEHEHGHDEHAKEEPKTYAEAVAKVETLRNTIRDSLAKKNTDAADDAVHEIGHVIEHAPELAKKEGFAPADQEAVEKASKELFDQFDKLDVKLHEGKGATFEEHDKPVGDALEVLKSKVVKKEG